jgi:hypothetical protein
MEDRTRRFTAKTFFYCFGRHGLEWYDQGFGGIAFDPSDEDLSLGTPVLNRVAGYEPSERLFS